ncbi:MAG: ATP-binding protein, partial [Calditrichaceae bacterium]
AVDNAKLYSEARSLNEELETRVHQRTAELAIANRELESFSYSVSHDLRAPLRHVSGFVDLLRKHAGKSLDEKGNRYISTIADSAVKMGMLIDDLLSFSRMSRTEVRKSDFNVEELVREIIKELQMETKNRKITWKITPLPEIYADRSMIKQAYSNLLSNAVKYSRPRKEAVIEIGYSGNEFFVKDNGVGFDMKYYNKLFGVFQRLHTDSEFEGTGIGLANVRRIIHRHGGSIRAESAPDKGTTFYFSLAKGRGEKHDG